ncbi:MAG: hypothetical protein PUH20_05965 [Eubacterium sp.]|nr:hypothetical protein [Eubacterium sp.]
MHISICRGLNLKKSDAACGSDKENMFIMCGFFFVSDNHIA